MSELDALTGPATPDERDRLERLWRIFGLLRIAVAGAVIAVGAVALWRGLPSQPMSSAGFALSPLQGMTGANGFPLPGLSAADLQGRVTVVNVWASWCPNCRAEHDVLMNLTGRGGFRLVGIAMNDREADTLAYLRAKGNPYSALGMDPKGAVGRGLFGARGVPTTFVVDRHGAVIARLVGSLDQQRIKDDLLPAVRKAAAN
jgi:cytochrome c biogenesis protein CcmG/thiol:disulfide interchange protein DsbE